MKLKYKSFVYVACITVFLSTGCKKLVEIDEPIDTKTSIKVFNTDAQADQTLAGIYSQMIGGDRTLKMMFGGATVYGGLAADEFNVTNIINSPLDYEIFKNQILVDNDILESVLWQQTYKVIYTANAILDGESASVSSQLTPAKRIELKASAKFLRAYGFFYLTNFYGAIPLPLTSDYTQTIRLKRAEPELVYQQIIQDLTEALALFSDPRAAGFTAKTRVNKSAVEAMLARCYLYTKDWAKSENHADAVISTTALQLETLQNTFEPNSKETIFQLSVNPSVSVGMISETENLSPLYALSFLPPADRDLFLDPDFYKEIELMVQPRIGLHDGLVNAFEAGDNRKTIWANYNGTPNVAPYFGKPMYFAFKYPNDPVIERTNYVLMRLAEIYLIRAEARAMQNKIALGKEDIDKIRKRAGLGNTPAVDQESLLVAVAQERRIELFAEWGHRFFDLKRTGKAISVLSIIPEKNGITLNRLLFPIPPNEILANSNLTQNPGY
ncbi:RagB/SusD family nutrient uptake outer membrane protein [Pedobacter nyackensis]|uniref:RagB/SusD family nutrient uptake outer membrane protein n=1 Tax=Pedobacter nyackensis TaxID=475255 RepID=UPI00292FE8C3|nr:RagB/SusD family nutrient uptake outer membrane protein [Pedobacter nyackensis]